MGDFLFLSTLSLRRATHYDNYNLHCVEISIHALLAESDNTQFSQKDRQNKFLSTLSLRRATIVLAGILTHDGNFYPRSPCGERPVIDGQSAVVNDISIHALLAESDSGHDTGGRIRQRFLSTLSLRRATLAGPSGPAFFYNFYPRSPCGERR